MLIKLGTGLRFRLAIAFAAFAAFCFVLPPAVLAFGHGPNTIACLSHADAVNHGNPAKTQDTAHHDHRPTDQDGAAPSEGHHANCCGLFCLSAVVVAGYGENDHGPIGVPHVMAPTPRLVASVPERPDRPPNSLLSV